MVSDRARGGPLAPRTRRCARRRAYALVDERFQRPPAGTCETHSPSDLYWTRRRTNSPLFRLHTSEEVVEKLWLKPAWLINRITQNQVPHLRSGADRGVCFTRQTLRGSGSRLPSLIGPERKKALASRLTRAFLMG